MTLPFDSSDRVEVALSALGALLEARSFEFACVIAGGATLAMIGVLDRATGDVDVLGVRDSKGYIELAPSPLPATVESSLRQVAQDLGLPDNWLNSEMAKGYRAGLPKGFEERIEWRSYASLAVGLLNRVDLVALKLEAASDHAPRITKHLTDLKALGATASELGMATEWVRSVNVDATLDEKIAWVVEYVLR